MLSRPALPEHENAGVRAGKRKRNIHKLSFRFPISNINLYK
jgi:hypothetical protein